MKKSAWAMQALGTRNRIEEFTLKGGEEMTGIDEAFTAE